MLCWKNNEKLIQIYVNIIDGRIQKDWCCRGSIYDGHIRRNEKMMK